MIELFPYTINDGIPSIKDSELVSLYLTMKKEESLDVVFYNVSKDDVSRDWWLYWMKEHCQLFVILESRPDKKRDIVGIVWLNNRVGRRADIHYCMFKPAWGRSTEICSEVMKLLFEHTNYDCFVALIPETNTQAVGKPIEYGFKGPVTIPKACYVAALGRSVAGMQYHMTRRK